MGVPTKTIAVPYRSISVPFLSYIFPAVHFQIWLTKQNMQYKTNIFEDDGPHLILYENSNKICDAGGTVYSTSWTFSWRASFP